MLQILTLDFCDIEVIELEAFSGLTKLRSLDLRNNALESLPDDLFKDLTR